VNLRRSNWADIQLNGLQLLPEEQKLEVICSSYFEKARNHELMGDASKSTIAICWGCVYNCNWQLLQGIWIHVSTVTNHCWRSIIVSSNTIAKLLLLSMWMCLELAIAGVIVTSTNTKLQLLPGKLGSIQASIAVWPQLELSSWALSLDRTVHTCTSSTIKDSWNSQ